MESLAARPESTGSRAGALPPEAFSLRNGLSGRKRSAWRRSRESVAGNADPHLQNNLAGNGRCGDSGSRLAPVGDDPEVGHPLIGLRRLMHPVEIGASSVVDGMDGLGELEQSREVG